MEVTGPGDLVTFSLLNGSLRLSTSKSAILREPESELASLLNSKSAREPDGSIKIGNRDVATFSQLLAFLASPQTFEFPSSNQLLSLLSEADHFRVSSLRGAVLSKFPLLRLPSLLTSGYKLLSTSKDLQKCDWSEGVFVWKVDLQGHLEEYIFKGSTHRTSKKRKASTDECEGLPKKIRSSWFLYQSFPEKRQKIKVSDDGQRFDVFNNFNELVARGYKGAFGDSIVVERSEGKMYYLIDAPPSLQLHQLRIEVEQPVIEDAKKA